MSLPTTIAIAADLSANSVPAVRAAAWLCRELGAHAELVFVAEPGAIAEVPEPGRQRARSSMVEWANAELDQIEDSTFGGIEVGREVIESSEPIYRAICNHAVHRGAQLIVLGTHGRSAVKHALFGSVATSVVRHAPCDVLSVRPPIASEALLHVKLRNWVLAHSEQAGLRHIVCAVDFSQSAEVAAARALEIAKRFKATLHLVHSMQMPYWPMQEDASVYLRELSVHAEEGMKRLLTELRQEYDHVERHMVEGGAAEQIMLMASQLDADLIVMGTHGRTGIRRLTVGSVAERVVRSAHVPVWIVRNRSDAA